MVCHALDLVIWSTQKMRKMHQREIWWLQTSTCCEMEVNRTCPQRLVEYVGSKIYLDLSEYDISWYICSIVSFGSRPTNITFTPSPWNLSARPKRFALSLLQHSQGVDLQIYTAALMASEHCWTVCLFLGRTCGGYVVCVLPFVRRNLWWLADVVSLFLGKGYDVY